MKKLFGILSLSVLLFSTFAPSFTYANEIDNNDIINLFSDLLNTYGMETSCEVGTEYMSGDYKGVTTENCGIKITEYNGTSKDIVIPEEMNGYAVKEIGEDVFKQKDITSVEIPDTVEIIGTGAFNKSHFINNYIINLPNNLKRIEKGAFKTCNLSGFDKLPEGLRFIGDSAFSNYERITIATSNLNSIKDVIIPNKVEYIGEYAFAGNPMDKIIIGNSVKEIGNYAFQGHRQRDVTSVTELSIPDSVEKIGMSAFYYNMHLDTVNIGSGNGMIKIMPYAFSSCGIKNFEINKDTIYLYSGGNYRGPSWNPYENIKITANKIIRDGNYVLLGSSNGKYGYQHANLILSGNAFSGLISQNWRGDSLYLKNITFPESVTGLINETSNYGLIQNFSGTLIIPGHIKSIGNNTFNGNSYLKNIIFEEGVEEIGDEAFYMSNNIENIEFSSTIKSIGNKAFAYLNEAEDLTIPGNIKKIGNNAFPSAIKLKNLNLGEGIEEIGEKAFFQINKDINGVYIPDSINIIGLNAFCRDTWDSVNKAYVIDESRITGYVTKDVPQEWIDNETCMNFIRRYKIDFTGDSNLITIPERQIVNLNGNATEPNVGKTNGYEFLGWYEENSETPFDFNTPVTEDKTLYAHWKSLKEKAKETTTGNVVYTNETTVTIGDDIQEEPINNSSTINLVSKEVETEEVKAEEEKITVQESEIKVTSDKTVEYEGGLEVYLEKTENVGTKNEVTEKVEGTIKFSSPVAVKIPITSNTETVKVQVKHNGEEFGYKGLTTNSVNNCVNGVAENDKYDGENIKVTNNNGDKYVLIYTCSASTFVAYTENTKPAAPSPAAGGGRTITPTKQESKVTEQEHKSADTTKETVTTTKEETKSNPTVSENLKEQVIKVQERSLTRGEIAVMTNILLDVYPQLTENRELNEVSEACENYTDEQNFTKDEKKAITRLCKLSIMGIHADNNKPLEEFLVNDKSTNDEFSKVINRSLSTYTEKDFSVVKEALKKLEGDEENVVFGTVYEVFMSIKNIFN